MQTVIKRYSLRKTMILSADLPLLNASLIDKIVRFFESSGKPALTVMAPIDNYRRLKLEPDLKIRIDDQVLVPVGINFIDGVFIDHPNIDEEIMVMSDTRVCFNVNTLQDLRRAERYLKNIEKR
jgi:GTP:adenosylcobinamide-phosphate guanylyltransferase